MSEQKQDIYMMSEVSMPTEYGVDTMEAVCVKCGNTQKKCTCKK